MSLKVSTSNLVARGIDSRPDLRSKIEFVIDVLNGIETSAGELEAILRRLISEVPEADLESSTIYLENAQTVGEKLIRSGLFEKLGRPLSAAQALQGSSFLPRVDCETFRLQAIARNLALGGESQLAVAPLKRAIRLSGSYRSLTTSTRILKLLGQSGPDSCKRKVRIAMLGNATFDLSVSHLRAAGFSYGIDFEVFNGAYNQHAQEILAPTSPLLEYRPDVVVIAVNEHSLGLPEESKEPSSVVSGKVLEFTALWERCLQAFPCLVIQHNFVVPEVSSFGRLSSSIFGGRAQVIRQLNFQLSEAATKTPGVLILDVEQIASVLGKQLWTDERMWIQAKQYPSARGTVELLKHQAALIRSAVGLTSKCVVLDLDNTLWGGIVGEDGLSGIRLGGSPEGEAFVSFQRYLLGLRERGIILAVCSKNNEHDALQVFDTHPEMLLRREHITAFVANWKPKVDNLREIAAKLNIGLDALVFVDDNPVERELVRTTLPEVEVPELPEDPSLFPATLHRELILESATLTTDDRERANAYRANLERERLASSTTNVEEFLSSLQMRIKLRRFDSLNEPRIVQLINKTNQFNLTTTRMSEAEVRGYIRRRNTYSQFAQLSDRFGDNGIIGILMASGEGAALTIDQWLISCRVLGRQVENVMLSSVWNYGRSCGFKKLIGVYSPTAKNAQVVDLYDRFGFKMTKQEENGKRFYEAELIEDLLPPSFFGIDDQTKALEAASF